MKIKFEYNENNESDVFVKNSKTKSNKNKINKYEKESEGNNIAKKVTFILLIILLITIIIFIILINRFGNSHTEFVIENYENEIEKYNSSTIFYNAIPRREALITGRRYINKCLNAISSIQNQNVTNIEIILINDYSTDESLNIIQEIQKNDKRIIIINNEKNMGSLYTRSIGILIAKGKFVFALDNDDMFFHEDIFDVTYKIAIRGNFDIVGFRAINVGSYKEEIDKMFDGYFSFKKNNLIIYQPKLGLHPVTTKGMYAANDYTIWGKCIKTEIYQKAVNALGKERYSMFLSWCEDSSIVFVIFNIAQSYIFISKYGLMHIKNNSTATKTQPKDNKVLGEIFLLDTLFEFSKNNSNKNIAVSHLVNIIYRFDLYHIKQNSTKYYLLSILDKMMNCSHIAKYKRRQVKNIYSKIINKE